MGKEGRHEGKEGFENLCSKGSLEDIFADYIWVSYAGHIPNCLSLYPFLDNCLDRIV